MSKTTNREEFEKKDIFGVGAPNDAYAQYFAGNSFLNPLTEYGKSPVFLANVTFEPGSTLQKKYGIRGVYYEKRN